MSKHAYWKSRDLVLIGVFAAAVKLSTLLIALAGGGMNPITLILKNLVFTVLLIVLVYKVRQFGVIALFTVVSSLVSILLLGASVALVPGALLAALLAEAAAVMFGGYRRRYTPLIAVAVFDVSAKAISFGISWLMMREVPEMVLAMLPIVALGYVGSLIGLPVGVRLLDELRRAGFIRS